MALVLADRVQEYSTTTGTGTLTLSGAYAGFQTFAAGIGNGNTCYYTITSDTNQWEVGIGTVGVGTLARTTLISSSTGAKVSFTGTLTVFVTYPAEKSVYGEGTALIAPTGALLPVANGGTGASTAAAARTALGLGTIATQNANAVAVTGGAIDGTTVGATTVAAGSFTTLNSSGDTRLGGLSGNQSLQVNNVASAVNYAQVIGAVTGGNPNIQALGTDTNIGFDIVSKGTSPIRFYTQGYAATQFRIVDTASAVNYAQITGAATGAAPTLSAQGSDANIALTYTSKGSGSHTFNTGGGQQFAVANTASAVDYLQATGNSGGFPSLSAQGASTNVSMVYGTKGTGGHNFTTNGTSVNQFLIANTASAVNNFRVTGGATGTAPTLSAQGSDANIDLNLFTKGTGVLRFGTYTAGIVAQTGYITITDAAGTSRRLLVG